jgi:hypothetical protein
MIGPFVETKNVKIKISKSLQKNKSTDSHEILAAQKINDHIITAHGRIVELLNLPSSNYILPTEIESGHRHHRRNNRFDRHDIIRFEAAVAFIMRSRSTNMFRRRRRLLPDTSRLSNNILVVPWHTLVIAALFIIHWMRVSAFVASPMSVIVRPRIASSAAYPTTGRSIHSGTPPQYYGSTIPMYMLPTNEGVESLFWIAQINEDFVASSSSSALSKSTAIAIFVVGLIPFAIATVEFWRRIANRERFGTNDPIYFIGEDDNPTSSRGRRILGTDALVTAYIIFAIVAVVLGIVIASVLTSPDTYSTFISSSS